MNRLPFQNDADEAVIDMRRGPRSWNTAALGMALFIGSWGMSFIAAFIGFALIRMRAPQWPPEGMPELPVTSPLINTVIVFVSSIVFHQAVRAIEVGRRQRFMRWLVAAGALAFVFLAIQTYGWVSMWRAGVLLGTGSYAGLFYALTTFHAMHVVVGIGLIALLLWRASQGRYSARDHLPVRFTGWFWHLVAFAWLGVLFVVYLW